MNNNSKNKLLLEFDSLIMFTIKNKMLKDRLWSEIRQNIYLNPYLFSYNKLKNSPLLFVVNDNLFVHIDYKNKSYSVFTIPSGVKVIY